MNNEDDEGRLREEVRERERERKTQIQMMQDTRDETSVKPLFCVCYCSSLRMYVTLKKSDE